MINCKLQLTEKNQRKWKSVSLERSLIKDQKMDEENLRFVNADRNILAWIWPVLRNENLTEEKLPIYKSVNVLTPEKKFKDVMPDGVNNYSSM